MGNIHLMLLSGLHHSSTSFQATVILFYKREPEREHFKYLNIVHTNPISRYFHLICFSPSSLSPPLPLLTGRLIITKQLLISKEPVGALYGKDDGFGNLSISVLKQLHQ